jgi:hypothetical protein
MVVEHESAERPAESLLFPMNGHRRTRPIGPFRANNRLMRRSKVREDSKRNVVREIFPDGIE